MIRVRCNSLELVYSLRLVCQVYIATSVFLDIVVKSLMELQR